MFFGQLSSRENLRDVITVIQTHKSISQNYII
ncbi:hypothetical protein FNW17_15920 [Flavobacterium franklandianum]|uniref:DUF4372 domain-containing protein n=1 Tax=Flavobacterium franklandianum TaxID=2594430 RepID=A0A553C5Z4_9FLAO|nr:hypothetical protein FNW17_15920 [Flavobacterium franklandianum]